MNIGNSTNTPSEPVRASPSGSLEALPPHTGPAGVGLEGAAPPPGIRTPDLDGAGIDAARRFIDRAAKNAMEIFGADLHKLLEYGLDARLTESVGDVLERVVQENPLIEGDLVTAGCARLKLSPDSPVRGVIIRSFIAALKTTREGTERHRLMMKEIHSAGLAESELTQISAALVDSFPKTLSDIRRELPLPSLYQRVFGEDKESADHRALKIQEKSEIICALAARGVLLDEVVQLVGHLVEQSGSERAPERDYTQTAEKILEEILRHMTQSSSNLPDRLQETLWSFVENPEVWVCDSTKFLVEKILLAGEVGEGLQRYLASRLLSLKETVPVSEDGDRWVVRMCWKLEQRAEGIRDASGIFRLFIQAKNHWPMAAQLTGSDRFLAGDDGALLLLRSERQATAIATTPGENFLGRDLGPEELRTRPARTERFIAKYNIQVHGPNEVSFVLPEGASRYEMLCEAQEIVAERDGRDLVHPHLLRTWAWANEPDFTLPCTTPERIRIDGHVDGGDGKTRKQQEAFLESMGLQQAKFGDLAAAFGAHWVATGEPLFGWYKIYDFTFAVRAVGGALDFASDGLSSSSVNRDFSHRYIAVASRALPASAEPTAGKPGLKN